MPWELKVQIIELTESDDRLVRAVVEELFCADASGSLAKLLPSLAIYAHELPRRLRQIFNDFKRSQEWHAVCVRSHITNDDLLGATPEQHRRAGETELVNAVDARHLLFASLLGEPFAWSTIQNGYVFNDVMPVREHRAMAASSGFASKFGLHTEDAFHPWAGDYLGLLCLRNPGGVATRLSGFSPSELTPATRDALFDPRFIVGANVAQRVEQVTRPSHILWGSANDPYMRINLNATKAVAGDLVAAAALSELVTVLERNAEAAVFRPGEFWYIDNLRIAHGRDAFEPQFGDRDRWLRRLYISSAFRYTISMRARPDAHVLNPTTRLCSIDP